MVDPEDRGPVFDGVRIGTPAAGALVDAGYRALADLPPDLDGLLALHGVGPKPRSTDWVGLEVGRNGEMPCRGGRMGFLEDHIRSRRRASRRCNYLTLGPWRRQSSMTPIWCRAPGWSQWSR